MPLTRREMLALLSASTFACHAGTALASRNAGATPGLGFPQGVASADPTPGAVMLWTRAVPPTGVAQVQVLLEVDRSPDFTAPLVRSLLQADRDSDFTLRAWVDRLEPDTRYFYRFVDGNGRASRLGRTLTAPLPGRARDVRVAFTSCQNLEQAYYGAWARMIADDEAAAPAAQIDLVLHLGDFIYERSWDTREDGSAPSRRLPPFPDGVQRSDHRYARTLADYRYLYHCYLSEPWLQAARARWPFVCTWDDHEFSDDNFQSYSHYGDTPLLEAARKRDANRAWFEFMPAALDELRPGPSHGLQPVDLDGEPARDNASARDSLRIYRRLQWGSRLDLLLTDSRSYRSPPSVEEGLAGELGLPMNTRELVAIADGGRAYNEGTPPATLPYGDGDTPNPARARAPGTCLGEAQRDWLLETLGSSTATWKLWGNPLPLLPLYVDMSSIPFAGYEDSVFNIDAWLGYPHECRLILDSLRERGIAGVVSLSGDHHMHGAGLIHQDPGDPDTPPVMADFNCAGISSTPLFDSVLAAANRSHSAFRDLVESVHDNITQPNWNLTLTGGVLAAYAYHHTGSLGLARWLGPNSANPGLAFVDSTANGYGLATFGDKSLAVELVAIAGPRQPFTAAPQASYRAHFTLPLWRAGESPTLQGPQISGAAPFPFSASTG